MSLTTNPKMGDIPVAEIMSGPNKGEFVYLKQKCCLYHKDEACMEFPCCDSCDPCDEGLKSIRIQNGEFLPIIKSKDGVFQVAHMMCGGTTECGKTYFFADMANQYKKAFPDNNVYYFAMNDTPSIVEAKVPGVFRIGLEDMEAGKIDPSSLSGSLVIIDDVDNVTNIPEHLNAGLIKKRANDLRNGLLNDGRHDKTGVGSALEENPSNGTTVYYSIHNMLGGAMTTTATTQANLFTVFPSTGKTNHAYEKVLVDKKSLNKQDFIDSFRKMHAPYWLYYDVSGNDVVCIGPKQIRILRTSVCKKE